MRGFPIPFRAVPPPTETVLVNGANNVSTNTYTEVGGTIPAILADSDDASYAQVAGSNSRLSFDTVTFADLSLAAGRAISSFVITVRQSLASGTSPSWQATSFTGVTVTPASSTVAGTTAISDLTLGPFTKSGGGNWTEANINSMVCAVFQATLNNVTKRCYQISMTVTYV